MQMQMPPQPQTDPNLLLVLNQISQTLQAIVSQLRNIESKIGQVVSRLH
jgi:hypothetical protein